MDNIRASLSKLSTCLLVIFLTLSISKSFSQITNRPFDEFAGMCLLPDDPAHIAKAGGYARPYILSKWFLYDVQEVEYDTLLAHPERLEFAFDPSYANNSTWINEGLRSFHEAGMDVVPSFKESFMFLTENSKTDLADKPRLLSEDGNDPWSWRWIGIYFYQFAAHYGRTVVPDSMLLLRGDQARVSGLGWVKYMQGENEADKWWLGEDAEFTPEEWAAYHSVMYDGHMGQVGDSLGLGCGIKAADPTMKVVLGPLAHLDYEYLNRAIVWWEANRTDPNYPVYPFDVMSFHRYANTAGRQRELNGTGQSPEAFGFYELAKEFADFCHEKGKEAWITEFGYDTHPDSPQGIIPFGGLSTEEIQGMWLMRSYLTFSAAGLDRAAMYMLRDVNTTESDTIFETSGFTTVQGAWEKKPSWYYFNTMNAALEGFSFKDTIASGRSDVRIYQFEKEDELVYAIWCPTSENKQINSYSLDVPAGNLTLITPQDGLEEGNQSSLFWNGGNLNISVNELPRFIHLQPGEQEHGAQGVWQEVGPFSGELIPEDRHEHGFIEVGNKFYVIGGRWDKSVEIYDPTTNSWSEGAEAPIALHHFQAVEWNGKIYILGALTGNFPNETGVNKIHIYDPVLNTWSEGANIPRKRGSAGAVVYNERIYLIGGIQNGHESGHVAWFDEYDPTTDTWQTLPDAPRARDHFQAVIVEDQLILASGRRSAYNYGGLNSDMVAEVDIFNFLNGTWTTSLNMIPTVRAGAATAVIDDEIIVIGGESEAQYPAHNQTEAFNLSTQSWRTLASLNQERHATQAITFFDKIYLLSGSRTVGDNEIEGHEDYFMERLEFSQQIDAAFGVNQSTGEAPLEIQFDGSNSLSASSEIVNYYWDFGDKNTATGPYQTHIYQTPGIYTVVLSITNSLGDFDIATQQIEVIDPNRQDVLFITNSYSLGSSDSTIKKHLEDLGYYVEVKSQDNSTSTDANGKVLVVISSSVTSEAINTKFTSVQVPVISLEPYLYDDLGMTAFITDQDFGVEGNQTEIFISNANHPLAGNQTGSVNIYLPSGNAGWGIPHHQAIHIAHVAGQESKAAIFAYEKDMAMVSDLALSRRVGFFLTDTEASQLTPEGWILFDSAVCWAVNCHNIPLENTPPQLADIPTQNHAQGESVSIQLAATDAEAQAISYTARNLIDGLEIDTINGIIHGIITANPGDYYVKILATDNGNPPLSDMKGFSWRITEAVPIANQAPTISPIEDQYNEGEDTISLRIIATDPENDSLTFSADILPAGLQINALTGEITGIILSENDTIEVIVNVVDHGSPPASSQQTFTWFIAMPTPENTPPQLMDIDNQSHQQGSSIPLQVIASDPDGDELTFSAIGLPDGLNLNINTGLISGTIIAQPDIYEVEILVMDDGEPVMLDTVTFQWEITPPPTEIWLEAECSEFGTEWISTENDNAVNGSFLSTPNGFVNDNNISSQHEMIFNAFTFQNETYQVWMRIRSGGGYNSIWQQVGNEWVKIDVNNFNTWTWVEINEVELLEGENTIVFAKREGVDLDQIVLSTNPSFSPSGMGEIGTNCAPPPNQAPQLADINDQQHEEGTQISLAIQADDPDENNLSFTAIGLPANLSINPNNGIITGILNAAQGIYTVTITVTDDGEPNHSDSQTFIWTVIPPEINEAPVLANIPSQNHQQTAVVSLSLSATDPNEGDELVFEALGLPEGLSINSSTGLISGTITAEPNTYEVIITVTDNGSPSESTSQTFSWLINEVIVPQTEIWLEAECASFGVSWTIEEDGNASNEDYISTQPGFVSDGNISSSHLISFPVHLSASETYETWLRIKSGGGYNSLWQEVNGNWIKIDVNNYSSWTWVKVNAISLMQGNNTVIFAKREGIDIDKIVLSSQNGFTPLATGETAFNCGPQPNQPPALNAISDKSHEEGSEVSFFVQATDPDGDQITYTAAGLPTGININAQTGHITGVLQATPGIFNVTITATDNGEPNLSAQAAFQFVVTEVHPNQAPILPSIANQTSEQGHEVSVFVQATDPEGDNIVYEANGLPLGLSIHLNTGEIRGTVSALPGEYAVTITVIDDGTPQMNNSQSFTWTIIAPIPPSQSEFWFEAECVNYGSEWFQGNGGDASNSQFINTEKGFVSEGNINAQHIIEIQANIPENDNYNCWARIKSSGGFNSIWQEVSGSWERFDVNNYSTWTWVNLQSVNLEQGENSIRLAKREGITIDKFAFSLEDSFTPSAIGEDATNCGTSRMGRQPHLSFNISPNPASNEVLIRLEVNEPSNVRISIINMLGQPIYTKMVPIKDQLHTQRIEVSSLAKGVYFVEVRQGNRRIRKQLVLR